MIRTKENAHLFKYQTNKEIRKKIDTALQKINALHAQMIGSDSTTDEVEEYKKLIVPLKETIKEQDEAYYYELYPAYINEKEIIKATKAFAKANDLTYDKNVELMILNAIRECKSIMDKAPQLN